MSEEMPQEIDRTLRVLFSCFSGGEYTPFMNPVNINNIRKYSDYFIIDEEKTVKNKLYAKLSEKAELFMALSRL